MITSVLRSKEMINEKRLSLGRNTKSINGKAVKLENKPPSAPEKKFIAKL